MKWVLIRHGQTQGNLEHRYIGCRTDEPLCARGRAALVEKAYPAVRRVFASPMQRCIETARLIYPHIEPEIVENFRECDFGAFENKAYAELKGRADYQAWIDSGGEMPFPGGESRADFAARCAAAFERLKDDVQEDAALVVHGGTIMAIMERFAVPKGSYYDFQVRNGEGYVLFPDGRYEKTDGRLFAERLMQCTDAGASLMDGCCGAAPEYIAEPAKRIDGETFRAYNKDDK